MQTMKQTWKKSLAAFALLTAFGSNNGTALADTTSTQPGINASVAEAPGEARSSGGGGFGGSSSASASGHQFGTRLQSKLMRLDSSPKMSKERLAVQEKLSRITLPEVKFDGLPLSEVINYLVKVTTDQDPNKQGINFVMDRQQPAPGSVPAAGIDPNTGLPLPPEPVDLASVTVKINPALKNVRLIDVLDAITKTADRPIRFSIEDYGVSFSLGSSNATETKSAKGLSESMELQGARDKMIQDVASSLLMATKTFTIVNTKAFFTGVERTFGVTLQTNDRAHMSNSEMKRTIELLFEKLGLDMKAPNKMVFFNDVNGVLMVRGTSQDLDVIKAAMETLGGVPSLWSLPNTTSSGGGTAAANGER